MRFDDNASIVRSSFKHFKLNFADQKFAVNIEHLERLPVPCTELNDPWCIDELLEGKLLWLKNILFGGSK